MISISELTVSSHYQSRLEEYAVNNTLFPCNKSFAYCNLQIAYHAEFEKGKGQYTSVADAPELLRVKKNQELVSSVTKKHARWSMCFISRTCHTLYFGIWSILIWTEASFTRTVNIAVFVSDTFHLFIITSKHWHGLH